MVRRKLEIEIGNDLKEQPKVKIPNKFEISIYIFKSDMDVLYDFVCMVITWIEAENRLKKYTILNVILLLVRRKLTKED